MENPTDAHRAGNGGRGSSKGRTTNHEATGIRDTSKILGHGRGDRGGAMARLAKFQGDGMTLAGEGLDVPVV